ncbi:MAG TPA: LacI family transcriptional regulator, partial [Solibacterales bacterium]|nr:LacI family transcriptional regulator [Bryobacterales bacterium]
VSAMSAAGLPARIVHGDFRRESGHRAALELLTSKERPDALFVANLLMTVGALEAARSLSLSTPQHFGLVTFDSVALLSGFGPDLTTVVQPTYELGYQGANLLLDRIEGERKSAPVVIKLPCQLKVGDSSRPR